MELSEEVQNILQKYRKPTQTPKVVPKVEQSCINDLDLIDVNEIDNLSDDQNWLVESEPVDFDPLEAWLSEKEKEEDLNISNSRKIFDSRTFTRPKKKLSRPSIDKFNEHYFTLDPDQSPLSEEISKFISSTTHLAQREDKPVHFDLSQPVTSTIFDKVSSSNGEFDSFQNMSPPSLVNSMCSSTFTNMENSYINKHDSELRAIRDSDYSNLIFSQDGESLLYKSISESCTSINDNFGKRTLNGTNSFGKSLLDSFIKDTEKTRVNDSNEDSIVENKSSENRDPNSTFIQQPHNGTFLKSKNRTFEKDHPIKEYSETIENNGKMNGNDLKSLEVYEKERLQIENLDKDDSDDDNKIVSCKQNMKNRLNSTFQKNQTIKISDRHSVIPKINNYLFDNNEETKFNATRRLSDEIDEFLNQKLLNSYEEKEKYSKRLSAGSTDSMDRFSSLSNSSRDSKLMAEVDAIVEQQERSLNMHVMSTPKPAKSMSRLFDNVCLSPIPNLNSNKEHLSDSEVSSEEYYSLRSNNKAAQPVSNSPHRTFKSLNNLKHHDATRRMVTNLNTNTIQKSSSATTNYKSSCENLRKPNNLAGSATNLRYLNSNLKGSYTNLKPRNANLPVISKQNEQESSSASSNKKDETFKVPQAPANGTFLRPKSKASNLPRPVSMTGIPRPTSRIPTPKSTGR